MKVKDLQKLIEADRGANFALVYAASRLHFGEISRKEYDRIRKARERAAQRLQAACAAAGVA